MESDYLWGDSEMQSALTWNVFWFPFECILYIIVPLRCSLEQHRQEAFLRFQYSSYNIPPWNIRTLGSATHQWPSLYLLLLFLFCTWLDRPLLVSPSGAQSSCISSDLLQFLFFAVHHSLFSAQLSHFALFSEWKTDREMENRVKYWKYHTSWREEIISYSFKGEWRAFS